MAKKRKARSTRNRKRQPAPGWAWMLFGLSIGLAVAAGIYVNDRPGRIAQLTPAPEPLSQRSEPPAPPAAQAPRHPAQRFDFYELLPKFEVVIPERERDATPDNQPVALDQPGSYVLQAGSFGQFADADRMKANLAMLGVASRIQKVTIDDSTYHRVRVGPIADLDEVNNMRRKLYDAKIEILLIRLPD